MFGAASILAPVSGDFGGSTTMELMLVGAGCGAVGVWVVQFGRAFLAESFTHALLPGLVLAAIAGASLLAGALAGVLLAYVVTLALQQVPKTSSAAATSVSVTLLVSAGALIATSNAATVTFESLLFGDPLAASARDVALATALALGIGVTLVVMHARFGALAFDRGSAATLGVGVGATSAVLLALMLVTVAVAANVAGSLLALALVTGPALGALALTQRVGAAIGLAAALGALSGIGGLYLSYYADWPASACVAVIAGATALLPATAQAIRSALAGGGRRASRPSPAAGL
ncbi:MAG: metal ABC transporter permease [Solirubrobacterales bacterium]